MAAASTSPQATETMTFEGGDESTSTTCKSNSDSSTTTWLDAYSFLDPKTFLSQFLTQQTRPDGRLLHQCRPTTLSRGILTRNAVGSSLVKMGDTQVCAAVSLEVGQPTAAHPKAGDLLVSYSHECSGWLQRVLVESGCVLGLSTTASTRSSNNTSIHSLCLVQGKAAWRLNITLMLLNDSGNVRDASLMAAVAALGNTKLPAVELNSDGIVCIVEQQENGTTPLQLDKDRIPIPLTVALYGGTDKYDQEKRIDETNNTMLLCDPTRLEEENQGGYMTVVVTPEQTFLNVDQCGTVRLDSRELSLAAHMAFGRAKEMKSLLL